MSCMTRKIILAMLVGMLASVAAQAATVDIINTWDGGTASWLSPSAAGGAFTQRFTVPTGKTCTKVEIYVEKHGTYRRQPGYFANIALYAVGAYSSPIAVRSVEFTNPQWYDLTGDFLSVSGTELNLAPGQYDIQVWGNTATVSQRMFGKLYTGSTYAGGEARNGWAASSTPIGNNTDFAGRIAVVPEPATMLMLAIGAGAVLIRRKR